MSETRLEKVIESTAEAETELTPETRLEKVILDTGRKIQEEIAEGGGTLYRHRIQVPFVSTRFPSFDIINSSDAPLELNGIINYLKENNFIAFNGSDFFNFKALDGYSFISSGNIDTAIGVFYDENNYPNGIRLYISRFNTVSPYNNIFSYTYNNSIIDNITEL